MKIKSKVVDGVIWSSVVADDSKSLILDIRNEANQEVKCAELNFENFELTPLQFGKLSWWSTIEAFDGSLFVCEYTDRNDLTNKRYFKIGDEKEEVTKEEMPVINQKITEPSLYEQGTEHFKTVQHFLGLDIQGSCEYLEVNDKIIMSYYLRSGNALERVLLVLNGRIKIHKEVQDLGMKGTASGAFFILEGQLFYIKNRNEVCSCVL